MCGCTQNLVNIDGSMAATNTNTTAKPEVNTPNANALENANEKAKISEKRKKWWEMKRLFMKPKTKKIRNADGATTTTIETEEMEPNYTTFIVLAIIGFGIWYFFFRKPNA